MTLVNFSQRSREILGCDIGDSGIEAAVPRELSRAGGTGPVAVPAPNGPRGWPPLAETAQRCPDTAGRRGQQPPENVPSVPVAPGDPSPPRPAVAKKGPRRTTLEQIAAAAEAGLLEPHADGRWWRLRTPKSKFAAFMGVSPSALSERLVVLASSGLATHEGRALLVDVDQISQRLQGEIADDASIRVRNLLERFFAETAAADGTARYVDADGAPVSLGDVARAAGFTSRGTAAYHLQKLAAAAGCASGKRDQRLGTAAADLADALLEVAACEHDSPESEQAVLSEIRAAAARLRRLAAQSEVARRQPEAARRQPEAARRQPEAARRQPEAARRQPEAARRQPEAARRQPEAARRQPEAARRQPEAARRQPEVNTHDHEMSMINKSSHTHTHTAETRTEDPPGLTLDQMTILLGPLITIAEARGMRSVNVEAVVRAAAGKTAEDISGAVKLLCQHADTRRINNIGGVLVAALKKNSPEYFPQGRNRVEHTLPFDAAPPERQRIPPGPVPQTRAPPLDAWSAAETAARLQDLRRHLADHRRAAH